MSVKKTLIKIFVLSICLLSMICYGLFSYKSALEKEIQRSTLLMLNEITDQFSYNFMSKHNSELSTLSALAASIQHIDFNNTTDVTNYLNDVIASTTFDRISVIRQDGVGITNLNEPLYVSNEEFFRTALSGKSVMTDPRKSIIHDGNVIIIAAPILYQGKPAGVITGSFSADVLNHFFATTSFGGMGYAYVVNKNGDLVAKTFSSYSLNQDQNESVFETYNLCDFHDGNSFEKIQSDMQNNLPGSATYSLNDDTRYLRYAPLGFNDWYIFSVAPEEVVTAQSGKVVVYTNILILAIFLVFSMLVGYFFFTQKKYVQKLKETLDRFDMVTDQIQSVVFEYSINTGLVKFSENFSKLFGFEPSTENFPHSAIDSDLIHPDYCEMFVVLFEQIKSGKEYERAEFRMKDSSGEYMWCIVSVTTVFDKNMLPIKGIGQISDAYYTDKLTGARNQAKFDMDAASLLLENDKNYSFVHLDLSKFKLFNDTFGYDKGNLLLKHVAYVIEKELTKDEIFTRDIADEYSIIMKYSSQGELEARLAKISAKISEYTSNKNLNYKIVVCIGVYVIDGEILPLSTISDRAMLAHSEIKSLGYSSIAFYSNTMLDKMLLEKDIENRMEGALQNEEFLVFLQPKYLLADESLVGCEALVRWRTADGNLIYPSDFIPIFERNDFIAKLDLYMFKQACLIILRWLELGKKPVPISVNFSRSSLMRENCVRDISNIAKRYNVPTKYLEIEITESTIIDNEVILKKVISELHEANFVFSMDDFGSGYSSLGLLKNLHFDIIKLDRSFFVAEEDIDRAKAVVASIISMSKQLSIVTVAEGVETKENIDFLKELGCDIVQGYYYSRPRPSHEIDFMLE